MEYFDALRPTMAHGPAYVFGGRPVAPLPAIYFDPEPTGRFVAGIMLLVGANSARWFQKPDLTGEQVSRLLADYYLNPEECMRNWFNYEGPSKAPSGPSIEDLGL